jgi:hypothetical protein
MEIETGELILVSQDEPVCTLKSWQDEDLNLVIPNEFACLPFLHSKLLSVVLPRFQLLICEPYFCFSHINADVLFLLEAKWREELIVLLDDIKAEGSNLERSTYLHGGFYICLYCQICVKCSKTGHPICH